jgi:hypothetical protein
LDLSDASLQPLEEEEEEDEDDDGDEIAEEEDEDEGNDDGDLNDPLDDMLADTGSNANEPVNLIFFLGPPGFDVSKPIISEGPPGFDGSKPIISKGSRDVSFISIFLDVMGIAYDVEIWPYNIFGREEEEEDEDDDEEDNDNNKGDEEHDVETDDDDTNPAETSWMICDVLANNRRIYFFCFFYVSVITITEKEKVPLDFVLSFHQLSSSLKVERARSCLFFP